MIGSEVTSACLKSSVIDSSSCFSTLASPVSPNVKSGLAACAALTASRAGPTRSCDLVVVSGDLEAQQGGRGRRPRSARVARPRRGSRSLLGVGHVREAPLDVGHRGTEARVGRRHGVALDQHQLVGASRERPLDRLVGAAGLARRRARPAGGSSSRPRRRSRTRRSRTPASPRSRSCGGWRSSVRRGLRGCEDDSSLGSSRLSFRGCQSEPLIRPSEVKALENRSRVGRLAMRERRLRSRWNAQHRGATRPPIRT